MLHVPYIFGLLLEAPVTLRLVLAVPFITQPGARPQALAATRGDHAFAWVRAKMV